MVSTFLCTKAFGNFGWLSHFPWPHTRKYLWFFLNSTPKVSFKNIKNCSVLLTKLILSAINSGGMYMPWSTTCSQTSFISTGVFNRPSKSFLPVLNHGTTLGEIHSQLLKKAKANCKTLPHFIKKGIVFRSVLNACFLNSVF